MSLLVICFLIQVVSVWSQSTLLDSQCDYECRNDVEIQRLERFMKDANEQSEKKIIELESKLDSQKISFDTELSNLNSQLFDQENKFENRIQELNQKVKNQKDNIDQLQTKVSELESKIQMINVESSTTSGVGTTQNVIESSASEDCEDIQALGYQTSGVYSVNAGNGLIKRVYCEMTSDDQAWTRILHRKDNLTDFTYRNWGEYEAGFGEPQGSHWMGLVQMHQLTTNREYKLRVDLEDWDGETRFAEYLVFRVGPGSDKYRLTIGGYRGTANDSMDYHNNMMFTTIDQDNDLNSANCAGATRWNTGGWWYRHCFYARLTGTYFERGDMSKYYGIKWAHWRGQYYSYKVATMKVQRL